MALEGHYSPPNTPLSVGAHHCLALTVVMRPSSRGFARLSKWEKAKA